MPDLHPLPGRRYDFLQLVAGVGWLVRDGKPYANASLALEDMATQETGPSFSTVLTARTALGHDAAGRLLAVTFDGVTPAEGGSLYTRCAAWHRCGRHGGTHAGKKMDHGDAPTCHAGGGTLGNVAALKGGTPQAVASVGVGDVCLH